MKLIILIPLVLSSCATSNSPISQAIAAKLAAVETASTPMTARQTSAFEAFFSK
jgi:outer membrane lipoprotein-sorting protein